MFSTASTAKPARAFATARQSEIDGIRGWASIGVLLFHLVWELYGVIYPGLRAPILRPLLDGPLAVYIFFVLSGDALSLGFTDARRNGLNPRMVLKRYFRLFGPILFSCLATYLLMQSQMTFNHEAAAIVHRDDWLGAFLSFEPSLSDMLRFSALGVFTTDHPSTSYNPFLWPMGIELGGSMLIFSLSIIYRDLRRPTLWIAVAAVALLYLGSPYGLFLVGAVFGGLRSDGVFAVAGRWPAWNRITTIFVVGGLYALIALPQSHDGRLGLLLASVVVLVCYSSIDLLTLMRSRISRFVGRISFPVYFMQFPVLVSLTSWLIVQGQSTTSGSWAATVVITSFAAVILIAVITEALEAKYLGWLDHVIAGAFRSSGTPRKMAASPPPAVEVTNDLQMRGAPTDRWSAEVLEGYSGKTSARA